MTLATKRLKNEYEKLCEKEGFVKHFSRFRSKDKRIPLVEIYELKDNLSDGILIVGMNPSGADKSHYEQNNRGGDLVYVYEDIKTGYFQAIERFIVEVQNGGPLTAISYSVLDVFGIVQKTQEKLQDDFLQDHHSLFYDDMINLFFDAIVRLRPKVIVVANAFFRRLFMEHFATKVTHSPSVTYGGYDITIKASNGECCTHVFFSSMLSGSHALDCGSRENLAWMVRNYLNQSK